MENSTSTQSEGQREDGQRRVAVVAIHGVGHHEPAESARAAADLLAYAGRDLYTPFVESPVRIPVTPVRVSTPEPSEKRRWTDLRAEVLRVERHENKALPPAADIEYMREQLRDYRPEGDDLLYQTVRLQATRKGRSTEKNTVVDVFDMYWTDLSRVPTTGLRMISELYQLLFYVSGLGRKSLDFARAKYQNNFAWQVFSFCQMSAESLLVLFIPIFNLCALGLGVVLIPQKIQQIGGTVATTIALGVVLALIALGVAFVFARNTPGRWWPCIFLGIVLLTGIAAPKLSMTANAPLLLAVLLWILTAALIMALMFAYDKRRPGAIFAGIVGVSLTSLMLACPAVSRNIEFANLYEYGLRVGKWLYITLSGLWTLFFFFTVAASIVGFVAVHFVPKSERATPDTSEKDCARRVAWTANLSLTLPGFIVLVLNLSLWWACYAMLETYFPDAEEGFRNLLERSTPWSFPLLLPLAAVALFSVAWTLLPSIYTEVAPSQAVKQNAKKLGEGLTAGFKSMRVAGEVIRWIVILGIPATYLLVDFIDHNWPKARDELGKFSNLTGWVGLALIAMIAGPGPLRALGLGLRTALDVAIDVANWLRLHPSDATPRAKICARYTSLLRYILRTHSAGPKYDAIVIFAHSQGTVISADLLRYFHANPDAMPTALSKVPIYLFTMGCPLRQLYSQRFPHQYEWARHTATGWPGPEPDPEELNVVGWTNAYRSGDYVGRHLWHADHDKAWAPGVNTQGKRREFCIGAGAHTHYWDDTAPEIAKELDRLVVEGR